MITREEKRKVIELAKRLIHNQLEELAPDIQEYSQNNRYLAQTLLAPRPKPQPLTPAIPETPEERARLMALLAEIQKEKK